MLHQLIFAGLRVQKRIFGPPPVQLRTERLLLRPFRPADLPDAGPLFQDPEILRYMARTRPWTDLEVRETVIGYSRWAGFEQYTGLWEFAVADRKSDRLLGNCSLIRSKDPRQCYLGYQIRRNAWGRGYATEAVGAVLDFGFRNLRMRVIAAGCHPQNTASQRVMEKVGLRHVGFEDDFPHAPEGVRAYVAHLHQHEWLEQRLQR
jgi:RimJ/RimL family protein N-acetyltransferase